MCCMIAALFAFGPRAAILIWYVLEPVRWNAAFDFVPLGARRLPRGAMDDADVRPRLPGRYHGLRLRLDRDRHRVRRVLVVGRRVHEPGSDPDVPGLRARKSYSLSVV